MKAGSEMLRQIRIRELRTGMRIADVGLSGSDYPRLYSEDREIQAPGDLAELWQRGFRDVFVNLMKTNTE